MIICVLAPENSPSWGGVGSYVYNLAKNLPKDFDIHIITINRDAPDSYDKLLKDENIHIYNITDVNKNNSFFYNYNFQMSLLKKLKAFHNRLDFDIIHSHSGHLPHLFSQFQGIAPMVVTVHSTVRGMKNNLNQYQSKKSNTEMYMNFFSRFIEIGEKIGFKKADRLLPVSQFTLEEIVNLYKIKVANKSFVVKNATDTEMFKPRIVDHAKKSVITFVGRFFAIKGFDIYFKSLLNLNKKGYEIKPYIIGRGMEESSNTQLKSNFSDFLIKDLTPYHKMPEIYNYSDIVIVPSIYENCPGVVLEAMSSGKIVIASNVGGIPEIIQNGKNGLLFEKGNVADLEHKIISILEETYDNQKIRNNARKTIIDNYQWSKRVIEIKDIYGDVLK